MAEYTEETEIFWAKHSQHGQIVVRTDTVVLRDGDEISRTHHSHVVDPDSDLTKEDAEVRDVATVLHTAGVKAKFETVKAAAAAIGK